MKIASWSLTLLLGALLFYGSTQIPSPGDNPALTIHVTSRYVERGPTETGIPSTFLAILGDYRGFDLLVLALLFSISTLGLLAVTSGAMKSLPLLPGLLWAILGIFLVLGLGFISVGKGSNLLDHEVLAFWANPHRARTDGALILVAANLLCLAGLLSLFIRRFRSPEGLK